MSLSEITIDLEIIDFLKSNSNRLTSLDKTNSFLKEMTGIENFFESSLEYSEFLNKLNNNNILVKDLDRKEYGDFQTNKNLTDKICKVLMSKSINPKLVIEPTCGKGNFIVSVLENFRDVEKIIGIEIYKLYTWITKFSILKHFIENPKRIKPSIIISNSDFFNYEFEKCNYFNDEILVIGNPPWITNSSLTVLESNNLPKKSNFKNHNGIEAITGKGNFDIGEYITLKLLRTFSLNNGHLALLVKNSVVKNIVFEQIKNRLNLSYLEQYNIDSKKEFNVSVESSLFICKFNSEPEFTLKSFNLYSMKSLCELGWVSNKFVSNINDYKKFNKFDGNCVFEWRQGIKHDCSEVMELEKKDNSYLNSNLEEVFLENDLVYGLLKSSDLKGNEIDNPRKYTIITQKKIGQDTFYIKLKFPKTYSYLVKNKESFDKRKSSIYKGKPSFSIFGIGEYSFKPYKVAISGLYKKIMFTLVLPNNKKPLMLDDTCYFIGFDDLVDAKITHFILNKKETLEFLYSIIFLDSKRAITKDILMRIDINKILEITSFNEIESNIPDIKLEDWEKYKFNLSGSKKNEQLLLFK